MNNTDYITYTPTETLYHEINKTFALPDKAVKPSYYAIESSGGYTIKCSKYDYTGYSIWRKGKCLEDRFGSLKGARAGVRDMLEADLEHDEKEDKEQHGYFIGSYKHLGIKMLVGTFNESQLARGEDKEAIERLQKQYPHFKYIDATLHYTGKEITSTTVYITPNYPE
jgi:hypothetical protein